MASITVACAELAVGALGGKMSNVHHPAATATVIHECHTHGGIHREKMVVVGGLAIFVTFFC